MSDIFFHPIFVSFVFLILNVGILRAILAQNRRVGSGSSQAAPPARRTPGKDVLESSEILGWEFEYARTTASEAMETRVTMINFYLVVVAVVASGVAAVLGQGTGNPGLSKVAATVLLWVLCGVGWLFFLKIIRLRQAWHDSAQAMGQIKEFYIQHVKELDGDELRKAFRWQAHTLPPLDKKWTVFFYSAMLIGFLDSVAYMAGGALIDPPLSFLSWGLLVLFGFVFFGFHVRMYLAFLRPEPSTKAPSRAPTKEK